MKTNSHGFTLLETLVAIAVLMISIVAPMTLAAQSLNAAYYARNQITAYYLAQEAIEVVRSVRDANILTIANGGTANLFDGICPSLAQCTSGYTFTIDSLVAPSQAIQACSGTCPPLQTNGTEYGQNYSNQSGWTPTIYTRTVTAKLVNANPDELRISVKVTWQQGSFQTLSFTISENLYRWINDGSGT
ncbi:MAG TPA: prepilin-type N-terminal cleavage/methylation domain-containing protein [Candidatus Paceibacterota bacterium]|nr:prepilin-type N-terminal cleavage/methylation domain-containing protein [Candidatus Paceibacterota bacterium]